MNFEIVKTTHKFYTRGLIKAIKHAFLRMRYRDQKYLDQAIQLKPLGKDLHHILEGAVKCDYLLFPMDHSDHINKTFKTNQVKYPDWKLVYGALTYFFYVLMVRQGESSENARSKAIDEANRLMELCVKDFEQFIDTLKMLFIENQTDRALKKPDN